MQDRRMSPIGNFFRNKWVLLILAVDLIVVAFIVAISINGAIETAVVSFNVAPVDAVITVNGSEGYENIGQPLKDDKNSGRSYSFAPGTYEIQISHADLDTKTFVVDLEPNSNTTIAAFLSKNGDFYFYTLKDNFNSFNRLAEIASASNNQTIDDDTSAEGFIADFQDDYRLYQTELPIDYIEPIFSEERGIKVAYSLTIRRATDKSSCVKYLCIEAFMTLTDDKNLVDSMLQEKGFNLEDFEIEYKIY